VIKTDHIGDFLLCLPAVRDFVGREPGATVGFVVGSGNRELAERVPWIGEVHSYDPKRYARISPPSDESVLRAILARDWDLVVDFTNERTAALAALGRPSRYRRDVGTTRLRRKLRSLVRGRGAARDGHVARVFYWTLGLAVPEPIVPEGIRVRDEDRAAAVELLSRGWPGDRPIVAVHAGAVTEYRRWAIARFGALSRELEERGFSVFLVGGPNDREVSQAVVDGGGLRPERNLAGTGGLPVTAAILERTAAVVANDGGVMHLAAAQRVPVVGIFGPTDPHLFGPLGESSRFLYERRECSPCSQQHCVWDRTRCLEPLETGQVLETVLEIAR
jgi:ADP-heptose:LPS heptosyltransferase